VFALGAETRTMVTLFAGLFFASIELGFPSPWMNICLLPCLSLCSFFSLHPFSASGKYLFALGAETIIDSVTYCLALVVNLFWVYLYVFT